tara:strand:+ start:250 stop:471 length:222 start_codon:yes stop_codon:yes gene_type:complete
MKVKSMKAKQFASGEGEPQPLDIDLFRYECEKVLGMKNLDEEELFTLARYLIEHYYLVPKSQRQYLRYSVSEA